MRKKKFVIRVIAWGILFVCFGCGLGLVLAEEMTITTYYPSPYGIYKEMRAQRMAIGQNYVTPLGGFPTIHWEGALDAGSVTNNADLVVEGNVGVGTIRPPDIVVPAPQTGVTLQVGPAIRDYAPTAPPNYKTGILRISAAQNQTVEGGYYHYGDRNYWDIYSPQLTVLKCDNPDDETTCHLVPTDQWDLVFKSSKVGTRFPYVLALDQESNNVCLGCTKASDRLSIRLATSGGDFEGMYFGIRNTGTPVEGGVNADAALLSAHDEYYWPRPMVFRNALTFFHKGAVILGGYNGNELQWVVPPGMPVIRRELLYKVKPYDMNGSTHDDYARFVIGGGDNSNLVAGNIFVGNDKSHPSTFNFDVFIARDLAVGRAITTRAMAASFLCLGLPPNVEANCISRWKYFTVTCTCTPKTNIPISFGWSATVSIPGHGDADVSGTASSTYSDSCGGGINCNVNYDPTVVN